MGPVKSCLLLLIFLFLFSFFWGREDKRLRILFTHDLHSYFLPHIMIDEKGGKTETGGYARLLSAIGEERSKTPGGVLLLDAGDYSMGTLFHTMIMKEASELRLMGEMGYDAATFGNHDFDFHLDGLTQSLTSAAAKSKKLPGMVIANLLFRDRLEGQELLRAFDVYGVKDHIIVLKEGLRIGIFGIMGRDAAADTHFAKPAYFEDPVEAAKRTAAVLKNKEKADLVICLSHSGTSPEKSRSEDEILAREVPDIDIVISGHTHTLLPVPIIAGRTIIGSAGCYGSYLGIIDIEYSAGNGVKLTDYRIRKIDKSVPDNKRLLGAVMDYKREIDRDYLKFFGVSHDQVIAESSFDMEPLSAAYAKPGEMGLGNLITDSYRYAVKNAEGTNYDTISLVVQPLGFIRDSFNKGKITAADIFRVLSLGLGIDKKAGYPLAAYYVTGRELKKILEVNSSIGPLKNDLRLQESGARYVFNPHRMIFDRVTDVKILEKDGQYRALDGKRLYRVCMDYYSAVGVDLVKKMSLGIMNVEPKDKNGKPVADLKTVLVDGDPGKPGIQEIKEWEALTAYLKSFPDNDHNGIPEIPAGYKGPEGRFQADLSWNPLKLIAGAGVLTVTVLGTIAVMTALMIGVIIRLLRKRTE